MKTIFHWIDQRTGLVTSLGHWFQRPLAGGPGWRFVWPTAIAFAFVVQAITGMVLWMYYSAGAQSAWESVYYLQYHVQEGWLLRAIHFYMGQAALVLVGLYLVQMIVRGAYRPPREFLFWAVLLIGLATLGLNLTGDLLAWDQNSFWATNIRIAYLSHLPLVGPWLSRLAVGGTQFGTFTLTRFLALHIGACSLGLLALILLHAHLAWRHGLEDQRSDGAVPTLSRSARGGSYWPDQAWRDAAACVVVLAVVVGLSVRHGFSTPQAGIELGAPANLVDDPGTARPEWSFRGLYQLHETLSGWPEMVSIFVIPGLTVLVFFAMPWIGRNVVGRTLNIAVTLFVLGGLAALSWQSYAHDAKNDKYQLALKAGQEQAERVKELAMQPSTEGSEPAADTAKMSAPSPTIPVSGALTLLQNDPKTQGPRLFNQHCASCHDYSGPSSGITRPDKPTAADLYGFAGREWLTGFMTTQGFKSAKYFGHTKFTPENKSKMYEFLQETFSGFEKAEKQQVIRALSFEAGLKPQRNADTSDAADIAAGRQLIKDNCSGCHAFHGKRGEDGKGPKLTGYGSRQWLIDFIGNPAHVDLYGKKNDRMPAFAAAADAKKNDLSRQELELLADWLRGEWYEPK